MRNDVITIHGHPRLLRWSFLVLLLVMVWSPTAAMAQTAPDDDALRQGAEVYSRVCSSCHQPGGAGVSGQFPPLLDNPNVQDTEYLHSVIANGLEGEIQVAGVAYDGRMPAFSTLSAAEVASLTTYVQSGFAVPAALPVPVDEGSGSSGVVLLVLAAVVGVGLLAMSPRIIAANDRLEISWTDAWLKSAVIVIWFVVFTVVVPSRVMQSESVSKLADTAKDLIGVGLWGAGVGVGIVALWFAQRTRRA